VNKETDLKADMKAADRGESVTAMEPLVLSEGSKHRGPLTDLALDLAQRSAAFKSSLPPSFLTSLATLVRAMNCYYSNLIEGHDTHPVDIERALAGDYSRDAKKRDLQLEAKAHIGVQQLIDEGSLRARAYTAAALRETHRRFCEALPDELLWVEDPTTKEKIRVVPGEIRERDVRVGDHIAISPLAVPRFMARFEEVYTKLGKAETILAAAAAHHRFAWIHPFVDGNGRVARLMSHAVLLDALDTGSGLSRAASRAASINTGSTSRPAICRGGTISTVAGT
jgi:Fic family protein